jgi:hypothetical protein
MAAAGTPFDQATHTPQSFAKFSATNSSVRGEAARVVRQRVSHNGSRTHACPALDALLVEVAEHGEQPPRPVNLDVEARALGLAHCRARSAPEYAHPG